MNLREEILKEHSKAQCDRIVAWVGNDRKRFNELFKLFTTGEYRVSQRSGWPLSNCILQHPDFMKGHFATVLKNVKRKDVHDAVKRNTVRLLQKVDIPGKFQGEVMNICFDFIQSPGEKAAVKAFALAVLQKLSKKYPEIIPEVKLIIEEQLPRQTPAFKSRAKQFYKSL